MVLENVQPSNGSNPNGSNPNSQQSQQLSISAIPGNSISNINNLRVFSTNQPSANSNQPTANSNQPTPNTPPTPPTPPVALGPNYSNSINGNLNGGTHKDIYYSKYIKYKNKYLQLSKQYKI